MKNLKAKLRNQGGFTLVEMLIVVAIIAILIAISIPMVNSSLERSQHSTDAANERAAKAAAILQILNKDVIDAAGTYNYNAVDGQFVAGATSVSNYGKHKGHNFLTYKVDAAGDPFKEANLEWSGGTAGDKCNKYTKADHTP